MTRTTGESSTPFDGVDAGTDLAATTRSVGPTTGELPAVAGVMT
ncbi:hypothetical protein [Halorubellus litoreus]|uniref:Uncharacterized protein n=1 Tax=Halorubellus litoreus TaxID=755308 RepID=A0ABD5VAK5_9EURY